MKKYTVALVQMDSQSDKADNMGKIAKFIDEAAEKGAALVSLPEVMNYIGTPEDSIGEFHVNRGHIVMKSPEDPEEPIPGYSTEILMRKAKEHQIYIHSGSLTEKNPQGGRHYNTSVMIDDTGSIIAAYRKLHTFDVILPDGTVCNESATISPGEKIVTADTKLGKLGFSICYDIRFPELFRAMALEGAQVFFTPANFTMATGKDHWEPILRTRAIENGCYVVAAAQIGKKNQFSAYGNSMVVDPWGTVIARAKNEVGVTYAEIDLDFQERVRAQIPSLKNRRADVYGRLR
ncbi:MAG: carbon-nitrogen hydrolase family protein [Synergistaceae bacterium]|jgi:predicted amidohydrolase|nr:carbon-nitrogen hydrolase family protein [Synergistaceae bacterium]